MWTQSIWPMSPNNSNQYSLLPPWYNQQLTIITDAENREIVKIIGNPTSMGIFVKLEVINDLHSVIFDYGGEKPFKQRERIKAMDEALIESIQSNKGWSKIYGKTSLMGDFSIRGKGQAKVILKRVIPIFNNNFKLTGFVHNLRLIRSSNRNFIPSKLDIVFNEDNDSNQNVEKDIRRKFAGKLIEKERHFLTAGQLDFCQYFLEARIIAKKLKSNDIKRGVVNPRHSINRIILNLINKDRNDNPIKENTIGSYRRDIIKRSRLFAHSFDDFERIIDFLIIDQVIGLQNKNERVL